MSGRLIPVRIGDVELLVETVPVAGSEPTSSLDEAGRRVVEAFERAQAAIVEMGSSVAETVRRLARRAARPDRVEVEFGLKFTAQGKVIVAGASAEAALRVLLPTTPSGSPPRSSWTAERCRA